MGYIEKPKLTRTLQFKHPNHTKPRANKDGENQKLTTFERPKEFPTEPITLVDMIQGTPIQSHVWLKLDRSLINKPRIYTIKDLKYDLILKFWILPLNFHYIYI